MKMGRGEFLKRAAGAMGLGVVATVCAKKLIVQPRHERVAREILAAQHMQGATETIDGIHFWGKLPPANRELTVENLQKAMDAFVKDVHRHGGRFVKVGPHYKVITNMMQGGAFR